MLVQVDALKLESRQDGFGRQRVRIKGNAGVMNIFRVCGGIRFLNITVCCKDMCARLAAGTGRHVLVHGKVALAHLELHFSPPCFSLARHRVCPYTRLLAPVMQGASYEEHGHTHEHMEHPGFFSDREPPLPQRELTERGFTVGIGGPVGSGYVVDELRRSNSEKHDHTLVL